MSITAVAHGRQTQTSWLAGMVASIPYVHLLAFGALVLKATIDVGGVPSLDGPDPTGMGALFGITTITFWPAVASAPLLAAVALVSPIRRKVWMRRSITAGIGLIFIVLLMTVDPSGLWTWSELPG